MHSNLSECYSSKIHATIAAPQEHIICCVEMEGAWFRAIIVEIGKEATCKVRLIDSGNITWTKWSNLRILDDEFAHIAAYSAKCKLIGVDETDAQIEWFKAFCDRWEDAFVHINEMGADGSCDVLLYSSDGSSECINNRMMQTAPTIATAETTETAEYEHCTNRNHPEMIEILRMDSMTSFFIQMVQDKAGIQRLLTDVQRYACNVDESAISDYKWKINDFCLVQLPRPNKSPHYWYRAKIVAVLKCGFDVFLRDEGVTGTVIDRSRIRPIDYRLCDVRSRAIRSRFSGIVPFSHHDDEHMVKQCMEIINEFDRLAISVHEEPLDCILPILLWGGKMKYDENLILHFKWTNLNRLLVDKRLAEKGENFQVIDITITDDDGPKSEERIAVEVENELENIQFVGEEIGKNIDFDMRPAFGHDEYDLNGAIQTVDKWLPADKISKEKFVATVTYVSTKCVVHVLDPYRRSVAETMQKKITEHVTQQQKLSTRHNTDWIKEVGQACFARFTDGNFYRASIRRIVLEHEYCLVRFVDYGNVEICKMKYIHPAVLFGEVPILTQLYIFANIRPAYVNSECDALGRYRWPKAVHNYCFDNLVDQRCVIQVIDDFSGGINTCELHRGKNESEFCAQLVHMDMASYIDI